MKRWVQMSDRKANNDLTVFSQDKLPGMYNKPLHSTKTHVFFISPMASLVTTHQKCCPYN